MAKLSHHARRHEISKTSIVKIASTVLCGTSLLYFAARPSPTPFPHVATATTPASSTSTATATHSDKIWAAMTPQQQQAALGQVMPYLAAFADKIKDKPRRKWATQGPCDTLMFGTQWGSHRLCNISFQGDCNFISFGISTDYSFDVDLAEKWNCRGFAADPTIVHPSQLHPSVTFHNIAAKLLNPNEETLTDGNSSKWWVTSVPSLTKFLGLERVNFLKLDCEGCEYSFARDILAEDPMFLHKVDQFSFETHVSKQWLNSTEALYYYAMIFKLLEEAGLTLQASLVLGCGGSHEATGCMDELVQMKFPCGYEKTRGTSCHDYLFARL